MALAVLSPECQGHGPPGRPRECISELTVAVGGRSAGWRPSLYAIQWTRRCASQGGQALLPADGKAKHRQECPRPGTARPHPRQLGERPVLACPDGACARMTVFVFDFSRRIANAGGCLPAPGILNPDQLPDKTLQFRRPRLAWLLLWVLTLLPCMHCSLSSVPWRRSGSPGGSIPENRRCPVRRSSAG